MNAHTIQEIHKHILTHTHIYSWRLLLSFRIYQAHSAVLRHTFQNKLNFFYSKCVYLIGNSTQNRWYLVLLNFLCALFKNWLRYVSYMSANILFFIDIARNICGCHWKFINVTHSRRWNWMRTKRKTVCVWYSGFSTIRRRTSRFQYK